MRKNLLREKWQAGQHALIGQCSIGSPHVAELMARQGYDAILVDQQHAAIDYATMFSMLQAISTTAALPIVRVAWNTPELIGQAYDAGAFGVICPMVNDRAQCESFVRAARYAPLGLRSWGPVRALHYSNASGPDYAREANSTLLALAMIETAEAVANLDAIMSVKGLDGVFVGPSDLSMSMGFRPPADRPEAPEVMEAILAALSAARRNGVIAGVNAPTAEFAAEMILAGFDYVVMGTDLQFIAPSAQMLLTTARDLIAAGASGS